MNITWAEHDIKSSVEVQISTWMGNGFSYIQEICYWLPYDVVDPELLEWYWLPTNWLLI